MERSIPHIRSIFSNTSSRKKSTSDTQDLCQYDKSPRSRRKAKEPPVDYYEKSSPSPKKNSGKENLKSHEEPRKNANRNGNYNTYTSKTLTERDMKHLERHLSMKKTIRKQISRNLAQAFLENPDIFEPEDYKTDSSYKTDHQIPPKQKIANSEQNVLDLLKISIEDRDSGHSSPTHETLEDTDHDEEDAEEVKNWRSAMKHRDSETKGLVDERSKHLNQEAEKKPSSIWKMFSSRNKAKR